MDPGVLEIQANTADTYLLAMDKGAAVGRLLIEERVQPDGTRCSTLRDVAVVPEARRRGIGRLLVTESLRHIQAANGVVSAETDLEDLRMHRFLNTCGFKQNPKYGFSAWILMAYPYREKVLQRVQACRGAGIEIRDPGITDPDELASATWLRRFQEQRVPAVPADRVEGVRRFVKCGGRTFFAYKDGVHVGTTTGLPRTNTYSSGRFYRDPLVGTLTWIESFSEIRQAGLATALIHHLMESFKADGSQFFFYRGFGYGVASHRAGMGMGRGYLRATLGWTKAKQA